jgi:hypothetical protein
MNHELTFSRTLHCHIKKYNEEEDGGADLRPYLKSLRSTILEVPYSHNLNLQKGLLILFFTTQEKGEYLFRILT